MYKLAALTSAVLFAFGVNQSLAACDGQVLFEDSFDDDLTGWVANEEFEKIENGQFLLTPENNGAYVQLLPLFRLDNDRLCFEVNWESTDNRSLDAGVAFWADDPSNYYLAQMGKNAGGTAETSAHAKIDGEWNQVFFDDSVPFTVDAGVANTLEVNIDGSVVSVSVNDQQAKQFRGLRPEGKRQFGLYAQTDPDGATAAFNYIKVTAPES